MYDADKLRRSSPTAKRRNKSPVQNADEAQALQHMTEDREQQPAPEIMDLTEEDTQNHVPGKLRCTTNSRKRRAEGSNQSKPGWMSSIINLSRWRTPSEPYTAEQQAADDAVEVRLRATESEMNRLKKLAQTNGEKIGNQKREIHKLQEISSNKSKRLERLNNELDSLEAARRQDRVEHKQAIAETKHKHRDRVVGLQQEVEFYREQSVKYCNELRQARSAARELNHLQQKYYAGYNSQLQNAHKTHQQVLDDIKRDHISEQAQASQTTQVYLEKVKELQTTVRELQAVKLQSVESTQWAPPSASEIEHELKGVLAGVRQWSQKHGRAPIEELLRHDCFDRIATTLEDLGCLDSPDMLRAALEKKESMHKPGKAAAMLLNVAASATILVQIIGDPFFAFAGSSQDGDVLMKDQGKALYSFIGDLRANDEAGAEGWRCQLFRLVDAELAERSGDLAVNKASRDFITSTLGPEEDQAAEMHAELRELMKHAAKMAWRLWTRKFRIEIFLWRELAGVEASAGEIVYTAESEDLELHSLHSGDVDDDAKALDGSKVLLVCSPAVVMAGNADGEDYGERRVLKKAVVWLA